MRIGFIGNLEEVKGADLLPGIMDEIRAKIDCVDFHVAGSGSYLPMLVKELPFVKFYGHVERRKALEIMRSMDVIIFPSKKEGFGLVPLESLFLGIPCVAYNIDGLQDVFAGNEELLCANMNATSYADLVVSVLKEGKKPRLQEIQKYSKEVCMRKERALYDRLLEGVE